ncbi:hypothetical protein FWK35_00036312 [Aphis craccivora]|uniref:Secreted protein n=1 Tax=Aphis craccivora TaxID=307492 RepID=A0A6G0YJP7_APHCR|nr:hypothetical protein FWK35_00036312 [Aphis craccivora]
MLCFFFVCLCLRERVEIMLQFQTIWGWFEVSDRKMNLVGALEGHFLKFLSFQKHREKPKKKKLRKTAIFTQNQFSTKSIFYMVVTCN